MRAHSRTRPVKHAVESLLVRSGAADVYRSLSRHWGVVLGYHNIVPDDYAPAGDRALHLPVSRFREQLDHLVERYEPVPLDRILDPPPRGGRMRVAITFDDAYRGAVRLGVRELAERGMPGTLFVTPSYIGGGPFWWDSVGNGKPGEMPDDVRRTAVVELGGDDASIRRWAISRGLHLGCVPEVARCATMECLAWAVSHSGITLAPHGWTHRNLTRLSTAELDEELSRPLRWLERRFTPVLPWLAYPYGAHDPEVQRACARAGYEGALEIGTGPLPPRVRNRYQIPRVSVPSGITREGFVLRAAGVVRR